MATADMGPRQLCGVVDPPFTARQSRSRDVTDTAGPFGEANWLDMGGFLAYSSAATLLIIAIWYVAARR